MTYVLENTNEKGHYLAGTHRAIMKMKFGKDALITLDIEDGLNNYKPLLVEVGQ